MKSHPPQLLLKQPRRGRRRADAPSGREALLKAALRSFARFGFEAASLRVIASAADVDVALIARLFGSKNELWTAVVDYMMQLRIVHQDLIVTLAENKKLTAREALCEFISVYSRIISELPEFVALFTQELSNPGPRLDEINRKLVEPFIQASLPVVRSAIADGCLRAVDPVLFLRMMFPAISVPLLIPSMRNDSQGVESLRAELVVNAKRMFLSEE